MNIHCWAVAAEQTALRLGVLLACGRCSLAPACLSSCSTSPSCRLSPYSLPRTPSLFCQNAAASSDVLEGREGERRYWNCWRQSCLDRWWVREKSHRQQNASWLIHCDFGSELLAGPWCTHLQVLLITVLYCLWVNTLNKTTEIIVIVNCPHTLYTLHCHLSVIVGVFCNRPHPVQYWNQILQIQIWSWTEHI